MRRLPAPVRLWRETTSKATGHVTREPVWRLSALTLAMAERYTGLGLASLRERPPRTLVCDTRDSPPETRIDGGRDDSP